MILNVNNELAAKAYFATEKGNMKFIAGGGDDKNCELKPQFNYKKTGLTVAFSDKSKGDYQKIVWEFGDGNISQEAHPTHTYSVIGTYTFKQTIISKEGCSKSFLGEIYVK